MAPIATRLESDGTLLLNGEFDDYTFSGNATFTSRTASNAVYVTGIFDEVTYNLTSPTIVNFISYSQDLTNGVWEKFASGTGIVPVVTSNYAEAPDGTMTADLVAFDSGGSGNSQLAHSGVGPQPTVGTTRTWSVYMRTLTGTTTISMFNGDNVATQNVTSSWQRFSYTVTYGNAPFGVRLAKREIWGTGGAGVVLVWGGQWESGSVATIYQPIAAANTLVATGMRQRIDSSGNQYVADIFDEFTGAPVVNGNLILWLDAGQSTSYPGTGTTWTDLSTNTLNGTLVNTPTFDSQGWLVFDRTQSERVDFGDSATVDFTGTAPFTLEAWIYPLSNYPTLTHAGIFNHESNPGGGRDGWNLWLSGNAAASTTMTFGTERFALGSANAPTFSLNQSVVLNNWHHIVTTYDGTNIQMYRNSSLAAGPSASSLSITNTTVTMTIASRGTGSYFDGRISVARIYNRALTADEVGQNFNANRRRYGI